jgi:hypothetical protein
LRENRKKAIDEGLEPDQVKLVFPDNRGDYFWGSNFDRNV